MNLVDEESANIQVKKKHAMHSTTMREDLYQRIAKVAEQEKRSVIKQIEFMLENALKEIQI